MAEATTAAADTGEGEVKTMRAVILQKYGDVKSARVMQRPLPEPKDGEVVVRVKACGVSFLDVMSRQGALDNAPKPPCIMGLECAGDVARVGPNVTGVKVGDRVVCLPRDGAWCEEALASMTCVYRIPQSMSYRDAAAMPLNYLLAYIMLFEMGNIKRGTSVLIHSAGGGVGTAVSQLVKQVEDITLFGTATYSKHEAIKQNYQHLFDHLVDYVQEIKKISPEGVDLVLDCLSGDDVKKGYSLLKPLGRYILYGSSNVVAGETKSFFNVAKAWWQVDKVSPVKLYEDNKMICGLNLRQLLFEQGKHEYVRDIMNRLFKLYADKIISPVVDAVYALEDVGDAMQKLQSRKNVGKILLDPDMTPKPPVSPGAPEKENQSPPPST